LRNAVRAMSMDTPGGLFECIRPEMTKGSPEGYNAETGFREPAQKPQTGEPHERQPLYRIRCTQEKHQLLREDRRRADCRGKQAASDARRTAPVGRETPGTVARRDGSDVVQRLDLRHVATICGRAADGAPGADESHRRIQEEERPTGCAENRRPGAMQLTAGMLCGGGGDSRAAADAALPQSGGGAVGADAEQNGRAADGSGRGVQQAATAREAELLETAEEVPESVKDLLRLSRGAMEMFEATQQQLLARLRKDPLLAQRVALLRSIGGVGEVTALTWVLEVGDPQRFPSVAHAVSYCGLTTALVSSADKQQRGPISKQRNAHLQTVLIEASKIAPRWNPQLAAVHARELERGNRNRATLAVARKLVAYLLAVDKSGQPFQPCTPLAAETEVEKVA